MKLALALPPLLVTSVRSICTTNSDGTLVKTATTEDKWDVSCVTNMEKLFAGTFEKQNTFDADLSQWDTSQVKTMEDMFSHLSGVF